jgi:hypothetical protein
LIRVYDLRHSFATEIYTLTGDPKATAELLMHSEKSHMMDRYTIGGVALGSSWLCRYSTRLRLAVAAGSPSGNAKRPHKHCVRP